MRYYIGLLHKDPGTDYGVSFPDFPGCVTAGETLDGAHALAAEALSFHIEGMLADGEALPMPTPLGRIMSDVLSEIDDYAGRHGLTRTDFLIRAAQNAMRSDAL
jgi:predicted RNase H-like HicB family nuclease